MSRRCCTLWGFADEYRRVLTWRVEVSASFTSSRVAGFSAVWSMEPAPSLKNLRALASAMHSIACSVSSA
jgi:hypothetical protein